MRQIQQGRHFTGYNPPPAEGGWQPPAQPPWEWSGSVPTYTHKKERIKMNTFLGLPLSQDWQDLVIWETFFKLYPVRTFIELGTGHGGFSLFLALQCHAIGAKFHTYDNQSLIDMNEPVAKLVNLADSFYNVDIFETQDRIIHLIETSPRPVAMFFDDGDKPREWRTFAPHLSTGDYCIVHDFGTEFMEEHINGVPVVRLLGDMCDKRAKGWKSMWFQRR